MWRFSPNFKLLYIISYVDIYIWYWLSSGVSPLSLFSPFWHLVSHLVIGPSSSSSRSPFGLRLLLFYFMCFSFVFCTNFCKIYLHANGGGEKRSLLPVAFPYIYIYIRYILRLSAPLIIPFNLSFCCHWPLLFFLFFVGFLAASRTVAWFVCLLPTSVVVAS